MGQTIPGRILNEMMKPAENPIEPQKNADQASTLRQLARDRFVRPAVGALGDSHAMPRVLTITSGKGGVGKSLIASNVAICLTRLGLKVLVLDADLGLANIHVVMGLETEFDLSDVINGEKTLREIIVEGPEGVLLIPSASGDEYLANLDDNGRLSLLAQFEALESEIDVLLIDSAAGIASNVIYFNLAAQSSIVVVTPEPTSITDAYAMIKVLSQDHNVSHFYLVVNRTRDEKEGQEVYERLLQVSDRFLRSVSIECLGFLPEDPCINRAIRSRKPVVISYPNAPVCKAMATLSQNISQIPVIDRNAGYPGFLRDRLLTQSG